MKRYGLVVKEVCNGCGICEELCPMDCIRLNEEGKPLLAYNECWYCGVCEVECPIGALRINLPFEVS
ncbi:MAG: 4Fe-4S binding protein [Bacillota bacterium]